MKTICLAVCMCCYLLPLFAQVGIGTTSPNSSAVLELTATNKGLLPPRVSLTGVNDLTTIASPAAGLIVYNTASAGTDPYSVTPGFYFYNGSVWKKLIYTEPDATIDFNTANPNSGSPTFNPDIPQNSSYIYVSSVDYRQWTWNGSAYTLYTPTASTPWYLAGTTTDAVSNKSGAISRTGSVGIGLSSPSYPLDVSGKGRFSDTLFGTKAKFSALATGTATSSLVTVDALGNLTKRSVNAIINSQTSAYTITANDNGGAIIVNSASAVVITVPSTLTSGFFCQIIQKGAGQVSIVGASGVTINSALGLKARVQNSSIGLLMETSSIGYLSGDTSF